MKGRATIGEAKSVISHAKDMQSFSTIHGFTKLPVVRYYGICRLCREIKAAIPKQNLRKYAERSAGYIDCLESASTFDVFQAWFLAATHAVFQYEQAQAQKQEWDEVRKQAGEHWKALHNTVVRTVNHVLKPTGWQNMEYDATLQKLVCFHQEQGRLGVDQLSSGIRTMIGLVADLAYRAVKLNPHLKEQAAAEAKGIVLIDEVDLHLHPAWQQVVIQSLSKAFPKLQFIVTTHSPQVLTTVPRENIRVLEFTESGYRARMPDFSPLAHESGDALAKVMGTHREPELPLQDDIRRYEQLVRAGLEDSSDAQQLRDTLENAGYQFHESDLATWRFLAARKSGKAG